MGDTSCGFTNLKKRSFGFTLIEIMIVIAVAGILAVVAIPKYQGLTDHYHLESSAQIVAGQLRNAKQYAMDRRTDIYVVLNESNVQLFYLDNVSEYIPLDSCQDFDPGVKFQEDIPRIENMPAAGVGYTTPTYNKCLIFDRKGFLTMDSVDIVLTNGRQSVMVSLTSASLAVKITWL